MIPLTAIEGSSQIKAAGFDPAQGVIRIQFHSGNSYDYQDTTQETFDGLMAAPSKGKFFGAEIKSKCPCTKVIEEPADAGDA